MKTMMFRILLPLVLVLLWCGCPPVAVLDTSEIADIPEPEQSYCFGSCLIRKSVYLFPMEINIRAKRDVLIENHLEWGFYVGTSGISPFLKAQLLKQPVHIGFRLGGGGSLIFVPVHLFGVLFNYFGEGLVSFDISEDFKLYGGVRSCGLAAGIPTGNEEEQEEQLEGVIDPDRFLQGIWAGGFFGCRIKKYSFEIGIYKLQETSDYLREATFDGYTPYVGISINR